MPKIDLSKFDPRNLNINLNRNLHKHWRTAGLLIVALLLLVVLTALITSLIGGAEPSEQAEEPAVLPTVNEFTVKPETFMVPDIASELWRGIYTPLRHRKQQWGMAELEQFYHDPQEIGAENLRALNQEKIDNFLKNYR